MHSCIYEGWVRHRRYRPRRHEFRYSMFMMYLDLDELPHLFDDHPLWSAHGRAVARFRRRDHHGDADIALDEATRRLVEQRCGKRPTGPIRLLTHVAYFGYRFNPVSYYYCFDGEDRRVETIVAEVNNTPWGQQHCYVLTESMNEGSAEKHRYRFSKEFHVSPFMDMKQAYDWRLSSPGPHLSVHTENHERGERLFDATLSLRRREITRRSLTQVLVRYPLMTARVIAAIHWQAFRLWLKRTPVFVHPDHRGAELEQSA